MTGRTAAGQTVEHGGIMKAARQAKMQAKDGTQARTIGTLCETARTRKDWHKHGKSQEWQGQTRQSEWSTQAGKSKSNMKGSSQGSIYNVNEASDSGWCAQSDGNKARKGELHFCMVNESSVQSQRCETQQKKDVEEGWVHGRSRISRECTIEKEASTNTTCT